MNQLNINPEMDILAREHGLGHWSCTDPIYAQSWLRSDGLVRYRSEAVPLCDDDKYYYKHAFEFLRLADKVNPVGEDWQKLKQPTLVQKPFKYPCDGALYFTAKERKQVFLSDFFNSEKTRIVGKMSTDGLRAWRFFKAENGCAVGGNSDNDLIMFVWE